MVEPQNYSRISNVIVMDFPIFPNCFGGTQFFSITQLVSAQSLGSPKVFGSRQERVWLGGAVQNITSGSHHSCGLLITGEATGDSSITKPGVGSQNRW
jgi:hypothetical protein